MFRRCISVLAILGLLSNQVVAFPHAHAGISGTEQLKHDATPHFHVSWIAHDHHAHEHAHGGHTHKREHPAPPAEESTEKTLPGYIAGLTHDASAVNILFPVSPKAVGNSPRTLTSCLDMAFSVALDNVVPKPVLGSGLSCTLHAPDVVLDGSDIYLTLRNLRI